jgi:hypothetical protein
LQRENVRAKDSHLITQFKNKTVLVTGASSGIGKAFAEALAKQGAHLVLAARSGDVLKKMAKSLSAEYHVKVWPLTSDLEDPKSAKKLFSEVKKAKIQVDVLINNAGFGKWGEFLKFDMPTYHSMIALNVNSLVELCHLFLPDMLKRKDGGIINVGSTASIVPVPYAGIYAATKAFVLSFTEGLYGEYREQGVRFMTLCPGGTATNFAKVASDKKLPPQLTFRDTPESVVKIALSAFLADKTYVVTGSQKMAITLLPRLLPRKNVIKIVANMWKKMVGK